MLPGCRRAMGWQEARPACRRVVGGLAGGAPAGSGLARGAPTIGELAEGLPWVPMGGGWALFLEILQNECFAYL